MGPSNCGRERTAEEVLLGLVRALVAQLGATPEGISRQSLVDIFAGHPLPPEWETTGCRVGVDGGHDSLLLVGRDEPWPRGPGDDPRYAARLSGIELRYEPDGVYVVIPKWCPPLPRMLNLGKASLGGRMPWETG